MVFCVDFEGGLACGPGMRWMSEGQKKRREAAREIASMRLLLWIFDELRYGSDGILMVFFI
jgi:hypothetical protein